MATLRYKNPTTQKWELVGVSGGAGGSTGESQIVFSKLADFPAVGDNSKIYIDVETSKSYIFVNGGYQLVGDGYNASGDCTIATTDDIDSLF